MRAFLIIHMLISVIVALTLVAFALESRCFSARIRKEGPRIVQSQSAGALLHPSSRKQQHTSTGLISHTRLELEEQKKESLALSNGEEDHRLVPNASFKGHPGAPFGVNHQKRNSIPEEAFESSQKVLLMNSPGRLSPACEDPPAIAVVEEEQKRKIDEEIEGSRS